MRPPKIVQAPHNDLGERLVAVERITELFKLERIVYLSVTVLALAMLLASASVLIWKGSAGRIELSMLFGSSGLITYSCGRVLLMWNRALSIVFMHETSNP